MGRAHFGGRGSCLTIVMEILTERLSLRPTKSSDVPALFALDQVFA